MPSGEGWPRTRSAYFESELKIDTKTRKIFIEMFFRIIISGRYTHWYLTKNKHRIFMRFCYANANISLLNPLARHSINHSTQAIAIKAIKAEKIGKS